VQKPDRQANYKKNREVRINVGMYFGHTVQNLRVMCSLDKRYVDFGIKNAKYSRSLPTSGLFFILSAFENYISNAMYACSQQLTKKQRKKSCCTYE
jgi:hypothetical protein